MTVPAQSGIPPATPVRLECWLRASDLGHLLHLTRPIQKTQLRL